MRKIALVGLGALILLSAAAAYLLRPPEEASGPISAAPLAIATSTPGQAAQTDTPEALSPPDGASDPQNAATSAVVYAISQAESVVRFKIDELLRNVPTTAIGVTDQVAGEIAVDFAAPANTQVGEIVINARTLATDSSNRNRMIQNEILDTAEHEFITFKPARITGLPESFNAGETYTFQISGELVIRDISAPATFEVTAAVDEEGRLAGTAETVVLRSDYDLLIPSVPSVADVSDEVVLEIEFVAYPK